MSDLTVGQLNNGHNVNVQRTNAAKKSNCPCCKNGNLQEEINDAKQQSPPDPKRLEHIREHVRDDKSIKWKVPKLQHCIDEGFCADTNAIKIANDKEDDGTGVKAEVLEHLNKSAKCKLNAFGIIAENGSDDLNPKDKKAVAANLKESLDETKTITNSSSMRNFLGSAADKLCHWVSNFASFILNFFFRCHDEDKEKEKKLCEKRQEEIKKLKEYCHVIRRAKLKRANHYAHMQHVKSKMDEFAHKKNSYAKDEFKKHALSFDYSKGKYQEEKLREAYYESKEEQVRAFLPPSSVCNPSGMNLDLDLLC